MIYDFVFVVLVYRNVTDLEDFFKCFQLDNSKVIVVNSFYDIKSERQFKCVAQKNSADFISIPNKGYGYGNNRGCEFALRNYRFKYLVISNADIMIQRLSCDLINEKCVTAPKIRTLRGKLQNPFMPFYFSLFDKLKYYLFMKEKKQMIFCCCILSRFLRELYLLFFRSGKIYAAHGAFVILPFDVVNELYPIYNEEMFLFVEEEHLAQMARKKNIDIIYNSQIEVIHKEDGSVSDINNHFEITRDSYMKFFKYWYK